MSLTSPWCVQAAVSSLVATALRSGSPKPSNSVHTAGVLWEWINLWIVASSMKLRPCCKVSTNKAQKRRNRKVVSNIKPSFRTTATHVKKLYVLIALSLTISIEIMKSYDWRRSMIITAIRYALNQLSSKWGSRIWMAPWVKFKIPSILYKSQKMRDVVK